MSTQLKPLVTKSSDMSLDTAQSGHCVRMSGVSAENSPATKIWFGRVSNEPGFRSPHHHGEAETGGFLLKGRGRIYYGENFGEWCDMQEGDFVFVPPHMVHVEANMNTDQELVWLTARSPANIVVNLPDVDDAVLNGFARAGSAE